MGWLLAAESAPVLLVGMFAGVWVDRVRRRPLLILADLGRAVLLACIPILALVGGLRIEFLFAVAAAVGTITVVFDVAYRSFVPDLVGPEAVLEANSQRRRCCGDHNTWADGRADSGDLTGNNPAAGCGVIRRLGRVCRQHRPRRTCTPGRGTAAERLE
jgi:hypothetical protein